MLVFSMVRIAARLRLSMIVTAMLVVIASAHAQQAKRMTAMACDDARVAQINAWDEKTILRELARILGTQSGAEVDCNRVVLRRVRDMSLVAAEEQLRTFVGEVRPPSKSHIRGESDPRWAIKYDVMATLLSFDLDRRGLDSIEDRAAYLFAAVEKKTTTKSDVINAEIILLRDCASGLTDVLLRMIDRPAGDVLRTVALDVGRNSEDLRFEDELLVRIDDIRTTDPAMYRRMLGVLGAIGSERSVAYFAGRLNGIDGEERSDAASGLRLLAAHGRTKQVRAAADEALAQEAPAASVPGQDNRDGETPGEADSPRRVTKEEKKPKFARPEEVGEDLSGLPSSELLRRLVRSSDRIERRKAAKTLGDRELGKTGAKPGTVKTGDSHRFTGSFPHDRRVFSVGARLPKAAHGYRHGTRTTFARTGFRSPYRSPRHRCNSSIK